jgi:hypothetical protein
MNLGIVRREKVAACSALAALIWLVVAFTSWRRIVDGVRFGSPFTNHDYGQHLLFDGKVQIPALIGVIVLHLCAAILGYGFVIRPIWGHRRLAPEIWLILAGVVPGTLLLIALSRVTTLFIPNAWAPSIIAAITLAAVLFAVVRVANARRPTSAEGIAPPFDWTTWVAAGAFVLGAFVFTVHIDRFHVVGEASIWFMENVFLSDQYGIGSPGRFPFVSQHYDEAALLYPVIYGLMHRGADDMGTFTAIYWIMLALGRVGVSALTYLAARSLGANRLSSLVVVAFICCASLSLNPISSHLLFDSLSPLAYALHVARFLIPVLPLVLVAAFAQWDSGISAGALLVSMILGIGLSSMPVHGLLLLPWGIAVAVFATASPTFAGEIRGWRAASLTTLLVLVACAFTYASKPPVPIQLRVATLALASIGGALVVLFALLGSQKILRGIRSPPAMLMFAITVGYIFGSLFLGNVFLPRTLSFLGHIWPWAGIEVAERGLQPVGISSWQLMQSPYCQDGYDWGFRVLTGHCGSLPMFARTYGIAFVIMTSVVAWRCFSRGRYNPMPEHQLTWVYFGIVLCVLALPMGFIIYDFLSPLDSPVDWQRDLSVWLRSRLVEPWFYGGMLLALVLFLREASTRERRWVQSFMMVAIGVFGLSPLIMPAQMITNFSYLFRAWIN